MNAPFIDEMTMFVERIERLACDMPAPNSYTPKIVGLCIAARHAIRVARIAAPKTPPDEPKMQGDANTAST